MQHVDLDSLDFFERTSELDPTIRVRVAFPHSSAVGTASTATVYFELEPGTHLGRHTDSAEELLLVLEGEGEATVGDETAQASEGAVVTVPAHGVARHPERRKRPASRARVLLRAPPSSRRSRNLQPGWATGLRHRRPGADCRAARRAGTGLASASRGPGSPGPSTPPFSPSSARRPGRRPGVGSGRWRPRPRPGGRTS